MQDELSWSEPTGVKAHVVELNVPEEAGEALKVTVPGGFEFVPEPLSVVHLRVAGRGLAEGGPCSGEQVTVVEVERLVTVSAKVPVLPGALRTPASRTSP